MRTRLQLNKMEVTTFSKDGSQSSRIIETGQTYCCSQYIVKYRLRAALVAYSACEFVLSAWSILFNVNTKTCLPVKKIMYKSLKKRIPFNKSVCSRH